MVKTGGYYFLSRPRRFGKSLDVYKRQIQKHKSPNNFQLTGTWYVNFCNNLLTFSGFADWWREETDYGKTIFLTEPQFLSLIHIW